MTQFQENTGTDGRMDRRMDKHYFIGPFWLTPGVQKSVRPHKEDSYGDRF